MKDIEIAKMLLEKKAVKINLKNPFVFTSGMRSPIYVDNRVLISYPKERRIILDKFYYLIKQNYSDKNLIFAGTATAAIPWAAFLAQKLETPMVYVRPTPKEHGAAKQVEGQMQKGSNVLVVEDMISTGGSSIGSANALKKEYQANILGVIAIYSHTLAGASKNFKKNNLNLNYLTDFETVVDMAAKSNYIKDREKEGVLKWKDLGVDWAKEMGFN
ncbi:MAG: orotate phosphoribosyltransferase [Candidatus Moranbacteria bacterium]|nr:orotate phosphoribosyltransferase [Candidatus Moranbacteria bacterium]